jgi:hypothetical protein
MTEKTNDSTAPDVSGKSQTTGSIIITLEIADPETVAEYSKCEKSFISDDLLNGNLMTMCDVVSIESNRGIDGKSPSIPALKT